MTFLPITEEGEFSPFAEWYAVRDQLVPLIGERAFLLFAFAICDEFGDAVGAARFRTLLVDSGNDVENPQVTEAERLLLEWARLIAREPRTLQGAHDAQFEAAFSASLRVLLVEAAALTIATNIVSVVGQAQA